MSLCTVQISVGVVFNSHSCDFVLILLYLYMYKFVCDQNQI